MISKKKKKVFSLLLCIIFLLVAHCAYASGYKDVVIQGYVLEKYHLGKRVYSIQADRATFVNKRIGFFEIALTKVIRLENVKLILYENGAIIKEEALPLATYDLNSRQLLNEKGVVVFSEPSF